MVQRPCRGCEEIKKEESGYKVQAPRLYYMRVEMNAKLIYVKENNCVRSVIESGLLEELIDQFCDLRRRVLMAVVANAL